MKKLVGDVDNERKKQRIDRRGDGKLELHYLLLGCGVGPAHEDASSSNGPSLGTPSLIGGGVWACPCIRCRALHIRMPPSPRERPLVHDPGYLSGIGCVFPGPQAEGGASLTSCPVLHQNRGHPRHSCFSPAVHGRHSDVGSSTEQSLTSCQFAGLGCRRLPPKQDLRTATAIDRQF